MPTRRIMELVVLTVIFSKPAFGLAKLWATKTLGETSPGSISHMAAETMAVLL